MYQAIFKLKPDLINLQCAIEPKDSKENASCFGLNSHKHDWKCVYSQCGWLGCLRCVLCMHVCLPAWLCGLVLIDYLHITTISLPASQPAS